MRQKSGPETADQHVREIRRRTRKKHSTEEKIRIVLSGLRREHSIAELCPREGIAESLYYSWSKEFLEAGKRRLSGDTARAAINSEVQGSAAAGAGGEGGCRRAGAGAPAAQKSMIADGGDEAMRYPASEKKHPVGRPSNEVRRFHANFTYQAGTWSKPRRVIAKVEWHP